MVAVHWCALSVDLRGGGDAMTVLESANYRRLRGGGVDALHLEVSPYGFCGGCLTGRLFEDAPDVVGRWAVVGLDQVSTIRGSDLWGLVG